MNHSKQTTVPRTKKKTLLFYAISLLLAAVLSAAGAEIILRSMGVWPWQKRDVSIQVDPGGKFFKTHPVLGYSHIPGNFTVTLHSNYSFNVTHLPNTLRITHQLDSYGEAKGKDEIWVFGCSFTHGWSINDEETYPWLLQERFPEYEVVNFGVSGYGTIHSLLQFRDALETQTPKVAILTYAGFHDARNTFARARRKEVAPWNKLGPLMQPYALLDKEGELQYLFRDVEYVPFPMTRHLAVVHSIENVYNKLETIWLGSHVVSEALVKEMARLAKAHGVTFILANISEKRGQVMLDFAEENRILNVDISVDPNLPENSNLPHDGHPSPIANQKYAKKLDGFLRAALSD